MARSSRLPPITLAGVAKMLAGKPIVAYYRVSTEAQGRSGLGLEGQQAAVEAFAKMSGGRIVSFYREVESGKRNDRLELAKALAHAKRAKATLVIAKLDRLARNVHLISGLMESGVDFVACDLPHANRLTVHVMAAVAEDEARRISDRTKAALQAYKARGGKLGASREECRNLTDAARRKGAKAAGDVLSKLADEAYADLAPLMLEWQREGLAQGEIAERLNREGHTTRRGAKWSQTQVSRVMRRFG